MQERVLLYFYLTLTCHFAPSLTATYQLDPFSGSYQYSDGKNNIQYGGKGGGLQIQGSNPFGLIKQKSHHGPGGSSTFYQDGRGNIIFRNSANANPFTGNIFNNNNNNINTMAAKHDIKMELQRLKQERKQEEREAKYERKMAQHEAKMELKQLILDLKQKEREERHARRMAEHEEKMELKRLIQEERERQHEIKMKAHERKMILHSLKMAGPTNCKKISNYDDKSYYPSPDRSVGSFNNRKMRYKVKYETFECTDPPRYTEPFYKLVTISSGRSDDGNIILGTNTDWNYYMNGKIFDWEPDASILDGNDENEEKPARRRRRKHSHGHGHRHREDGHDHHRKTRRSKSSRSRSSILY